MLHSDVKREVDLRIIKAYRDACIAAGLKGENGTEPKLSHLEYELKTLPLQKLDLFITAFIKAALEPD